MTTLPRSLLVACAALVFGASVAYAQPNHSRHGDQRANSHSPRVKPNHQGQRPHARPPQARPPHARPPQHTQRPVRPDYRPDYTHGLRPPVYHSPPPHARYGAGPNRNWYRGSRLPSAYRTQHYVVRDWRGHHLYAPPRGHYWVQNGADYLLVAIATGVIVQIMLSN